MSTTVTTPQQYNFYVVGKAPIIRDVSYSAKTEEPIQHKDHPLAHHSSILTAIVPLRAQKGSFLVSSYDKTLSVVKQANDTFEKVIQFKAHNEEVMSACELDTNKVVSGGFDSCFKIWDLNTIMTQQQQEASSEDHQPIHTVKMEEDDLACYRVKADRLNQRLFVLSVDRFVRLYDANTCTMTHKFQGHSDRVRDVHYNAQNSTLVTVGDDRRVQLWDLRQMKLLHTFLGTAQQTMCVTTCGERVVVGGVLGDMKVFDLRTLSSQPSVEAAIEISEAHEKVISGIQAVNSSTCVTIGGNDGCVKVWNVTDGTNLAVSNIGDVLLDVCVQRN